MLSDYNYVLPEYFGWFRPYFLFLFIGFLIVVSVTMIKAKMKNIPLLPFEKFIFILLPVGLLFASFFGKLDIKHPLPFYQLFEFWNAGLSIHGAIIGGLIAGLLFFPSQSKKYGISMWVWIDIIAPNVLIGQAIGRWGNFFNHEILGNIVSLDHLSNWLPDWIWKSCFRFDLSSSSEYIPETNASGIIYRQPLFLYESISTFSLWIILTFIIPNLGKWFGNKKWKYENHINNLKWKDKWNFLYYELEIDKNLAKKYTSNFKQMRINSKKLITKNEKIKLWFKNNNRYIKYLFKRSSKKLKKAHNPYKITIIYSGLCGSLYFFGYNLIRLGLETQRQESEMFIKNLPWLSFSIIALFMIFGLISAIFAQFISPNKWRRQGWYYEKQY